MQGAIDLLITRVPLSRHLLAPERLRLLRQFVQFGLVGLIGFVADTATVYALRGPLGLYGAGLVSYVVAATVTWVFNRIWTFRGQGSGPWHHQWIRFLLATLLGAVLNRGTYFVMIAAWPVAAAYPVIAVFGGAVAGMFANFAMVRKFVYRS
jgi:putative flippase GtrA